MSKFIPYHAESISKAKELAAGKRLGRDKYDAITSYIKTNFVYDYVRAITITKKNVYPDVSYCWEHKMGICQDIAAMTVGMLRAVGINATLCIGNADGQHHAWVEAIINKKKYRFDHPHIAKAYKIERRYKG